MTWLALLALTALGGSLRFIGLAAQSFWVDEYLWTRTAMLSSLRRIVLLDDGYPPTMALLFRAMTSLGLGSDWWLRSPSALAGTLAVPAVYLVARRLADRSTALVAAALLAVHPLAIWYSQEAGAYSIMMLAAILSTYYLLRLMQGGGLKSGAAYALCAGVGFGVHYYFVFVLMAHAPFVLADFVRRRESRRTWLATAGLCILALGLFLPLFFDDVRGQKGYDRAQEFSILAMPYTAQTFAGGFALGPAVRAIHPGFRSGVTPWREIAENFVLPTLGVALLVVLSVRAFPAWRGRRLALLLTMILVPLLAPWLNSLLGVGYRPRYSLPALPFLLVWCAGAIHGRFRPSRALLLGLAAIEAIGFVFSLTPDHRREDNRSAAAFVESQGGGDVLLLGEGADPFKRYGQGLPRVIDLDTLDVEDAGRLKTLLATYLTGPGDLWLVSSRPWTEDPEDRVLTYLRQALPLVEVREFPGVVTRRFGRARPATALHRPG